MPVHVFADTNIWLHFRPLEDLEWPTILGADSVVFVVTPPLIRELDKRKYDARTRNRARRALTQIGNWADGRSTSIRDLVYGLYWAPARVPDASALHLDPQHADDVMIAYAKSYAAEHRGARVLMLTDDLEPRLTARRLGLEAIEPPEIAREADQPDPVEAQLRKTQQELRELQNRLPVLRVKIVDGSADGSRVEARVRPPEATLDEFRNRVLTEAANHVPDVQPPRSRPSAPESPSMATEAKVFDLSSLADLTSAMDPIEPREFERYARERETYLADVAKLAEENWRVTEANARTVLLSLQLENVGTAPAADIDVRIHVPDGPAVRTKLGDQKELPAVPRQPRTRFQAMADIGQPFSYLVSDVHRLIDVAPRAPANVSAPTIRRTNSFDVTWHIRSLKQHTVVSLGDIALVFPSLDEARSLTLNCRINSASLPKPKESDLHVIVSRV